MGHRPPRLDTFDGERLGQLGRVRHAYAVGLEQPVHRVVDRGEHVRGVAVPAVGGALCGGGDNAFGLVRAFVGVEDEAAGQVFTENGRGRSGFNERDRATLFKGRRLEPAVDRLRHHGAELAV